MLPLLISAAFAGYGDPVDGHPSHVEREVQLWTNVARVDPGYLRENLRCWDEFSSEEKSPKPPLAHHDGLNEIARLHSEDMLQWGQLSHDSSDGSSMGQRVMPYYDSSFVGENVAWNYPDAYTVVLGWLCSTGHRANIMEPGWVEFGAGAAQPYWTQNFGGSSRRSVRPMNMGVHLPEFPGSDVTLYVDVYGDAKGGVFAVVDGERIRMRLMAGEEDQGVYRRVLDVLDDDCHVYWFEADVDGQAARFPEKGAYAFGDCDFDDEDAQWVNRKQADELAGVADEGEDDGLSASPVIGPNGVVTEGCSHTGSSGLGGLALLGLLAFRRRIRARPAAERAHL